MANLDDEKKKSIKKIFDSKFKGNNIDSDFIDEKYDSNLLGEDVVYRIRNISINDVEFGRVVRKLNAYIEQINESTGNRLIPCPLNICLSKSELNDICSIDSYLKIASHKDDKILKNLVLKIEGLSSEITKKLSYLSIQLQDLKGIIDSEKLSNSTNHKLRMNLLRQIYTSNTVRIDGIRNLLDVSHIALTNAHNFLQYAKPKIDFNLASKVQAVALESSMNNLNKSIMGKFKNFNKACVFLFISIKIIFYSSILFFLENSFFYYLNKIKFEKAFELVLIFSCIYMALIILYSLHRNLVSFNVDSENLEKEYFKYIRSLALPYVHVLVPLISVLPFIINIEDINNLYKANTCFYIIFVTFAFYNLSKLYVAKANIPLAVLISKLNIVYYLYLDSKK